MNIQTCFALAMIIFLISSIACLFFMCSMPYKYYDIRSLDPSNINDYNEDTELCDTNDFPESEFTSVDVDNEKRKDIRKFLMKIGI